MFNIPCVIFAGGKSSRMGEDKSLLPFPPYKTLTEFQLRRLEKIFTSVYISCKDETKFDFEAKFIKDIEEEKVFAPTQGFISLFQTLQEEKVFVLSVDTPFVNKSIIEKLIKSDNDNFDATIARTSQGIQPLCGIYHKILLNEFEAMSKAQNHKLGFLLKNANTHFVDFKEEIPFLNINYKKEYKEALTHNLL